MEDNSNIGAELMGQATPQGREPIVRKEDLSHLIRTKRWAERLTLEEAAKKIGVSAATLSRWERGGGQTRTARGQNDSGKGLREPDTRTLAALTRWLGVSIDRMVDTEPSQHNGVESAGEATPTTVDTLDIVEAHLRADRNLDPEAAELLARVFRAVYEHVSGTGSDPSQEDENVQAIPVQPSDEPTESFEVPQDSKLER